MTKKLTRVIRAKRKKKRVKDAAPKTNKGRRGYDMSFRATGVRPESKTDQNARFN